MKTKESQNLQEFTNQAWEDLINAINPSDISVEVQNGVVTLRGNVESYSRRVLAEQIVSSLTGVKAIANNLVVKASLKRTDNELLNTVFDALNEDFFVKTVEKIPSSHSIDRQLHHPAIVTTQEFYYWEIFA